MDGVGDHHTLANDHLTASRLIEDRLHGVERLLPVDLGLGQVQDQVGPDLGTDLRQQPCANSWRQILEMLGETLAELLSELGQIDEFGFRGELGDGVVGYGVDVILFACQLLNDLRGAYHRLQPHLFQPTLYPFDHRSDIFQGLYTGPGFFRNLLFKIVRKGQASRFADGRVGCGAGFFQPGEGSDKLANYGIDHAGIPFIGGQNPTGGILPALARGLHIFYENVAVRLDVSGSDLPNIRDV